MTGAAGSVLLVDDDEAKRYVMATWLRRAGHTVTEVGTGAEALASAGLAELILLDVNLPDMSGFDVCRTIKGDARTAAIPVIQVSATAVAVTDRARGLTQGADAYLIDPSEPEELLATVTAMLRYSRARQRAERTAALLSVLASVNMDINAAETFGGLARAATAGAARVFGVQAVLLLQMPDGQVSSTSASPQRPDPVRRGGPPALADRVAGHVLGDRQASAVASLSAEEWLRLMPDSTLREDVCLAAARTKPDQAAGRAHRGRGRCPRRGGNPGPAPARPVGCARGRGAAFLRRRAPDRPDAAAELPARGAARGTGPGYVVPLHPGQRSG